MRLRFGAAGTLGTVCARGACPAWSCGPSTSPLDAHETQEALNLTALRLCDLRLRHQRWTRHNL
jgi:hypothetical protein